MREVLDALEWVRREMMHRGSPDFIRQRQLEARVADLCASLALGGSSGGRLPGADPSANPTQRRAPNFAKNRRPATRK